MVQVTNMTSETRDFLKSGGKVTNGVPETESLTAGETGDIDIDLESPQVRAAIFAGAIAVEGMEPHEAMEGVETASSAGEQEIQSSVKRSPGRPRKQT